MSTAYTGGLRVFIYALTFGLTLSFASGDLTHFWKVLWDQIRDWGIAASGHGPAAGWPADPFPASRSAPAFTGSLGDSRHRRPVVRQPAHAGGIGQAILQSAADVLLLAAVWKRARSLPIAILAVVLLATSAYDVALAPLVWRSGDRDHSSQKRRSRWSCWSGIVDRRDARRWSRRWPEAPFTGQPDGLRGAGRVRRDAGSRRRFRNAGR